MSNETFAGDKKVGESFLGPWEKRFVKRWVPLVPSWIETYHLTLLTLLWSALALVFFGLAKLNLHWLWAVSLMIFLQYITDLFDGAIGRHRDTGLVKWGFHMDHFLDYIFQSVIVIGYYLMAPEGLAHYFFGLLLLTGGYMVNSFLWFAATNRFEISYFGVGPTEIRLLVIAMNASIVFIGTSWWTITVPLFFWAFLIGLVVLVFQTQRKLWKIDMEAKNTKGMNR